MKRTNSYPSLMLMMLALTACGGGGGSTDATTGTRPAETATPVENGSTTGTKPTEAAQPVGTPTTNTGASGSTAGGTQTPPPVPTPSPTLASTAQVIEYYGDSTVRGYVSGSNGNGTVAETAPQAFDRNLPNSPDQVVRNQGVDGDTACNMLNGIDRDSQSWASRMESSDATVVIINHGINEVLSPNPSYRRTASQYADCLRSLINTARSNGKFVILETPNPVAFGEIEQHVNAMRSVANEQNPRVPVIDQFAFINSWIAADPGRSMDAFAPDGIHPSQAGYTLKGEYAAQQYRTFTK